MSNRLGNGGSHAGTVPNMATAGWLIRATARDAAGLSAAMTTQPLPLVRANTPPVLATGATAINPPALRPQRTYFWQVLASDGKATNAGPGWSFTTAAGARPQPHLAQFKGETDGGFGFHFNGLFGAEPVVPASTNLVDWVTVATGGRANGASIFLASTATNRHRRCYRVITP